MLSQSLHNDIVTRGVFNCPVRLVTTFVLLNLDSKSSTNKSLHRFFRRQKAFKVFRIMPTLQNRYVKWLVRVFRIAYFIPRHSTGCDSDTDCVNCQLTVLSLLYFISFMNNGRFCAVFRSLLIQRCVHYTFYQARN